ncbi:MAG: hypothetical protein ACLGG9_01335 [Thermoleophilia bacterium]|jgi:hypothetical protein
MTRTGSRGRRLDTRARAAIACLVLGIALIFPFEYPATLAAGVLFLIAFVVVGTFAIVTPGYLADPSGESDPPDEGA